MTTTRHDHDLWDDDCEPSCPAWAGNETDTKTWARSCPRFPDNGTDPFVLFDKVSGEILDQGTEQEMTHLQGRAGDEDAPYPARQYTLAIGRVQS